MDLGLTGTDVGVGLSPLSPPAQEQISNAVKRWCGVKSEIQMPDIAIDIPEIDISMLDPPDFIVSGLARPKTARVTMACSAACAAACAAAAAACADAAACCHHTHTQLLWGSPGFWEVFWCFFGGVWRCSFLFFCAFFTCAKLGLITSKLTLVGVGAACAVATRSCAGPSG